MPRIKALCEGLGWKFADSPPLPSDPPLKFVWQNCAKCTGDWLEAHRSALVFNKLSGTRILEDKALLALLLDRTSSEDAREIKILESHVVIGGDSVSSFLESAVSCTLALHLTLAFRTSLLRWHAHFCPSNRRKRSGGS